MNLFNNTFSQLDKLSNEMNTHFTENFGNDWTSSLMVTPKVNLKETPEAYLIEGEVPGVEKKDISLDWVDDSTLVLKTKSEKVVEHKPSAPADDESQTQKAAEGQTSEPSTEVTTTNANKEIAHTEHKPVYHHVERSTGSYMRAFQLPGNVKHDEVKAALKNGVLTVTIPKVQDNDKPKSRTVTIEDEVDANADGEAEKAKL